MRSACGDRLDRRKDKNDCSVSRHRDDVAGSLGTFGPVFVAGKPPAQQHVIIHDGIHADLRPCLSLAPLAFVLLCLVEFVGASLREQHCASEVGLTAKFKSFPF